jgi:small subunit ribosomal protein S9
MADEENPDSAASSPEGEEVQADSEGSTAQDDPVAESAAEAEPSEEAAEPAAVAEDVPSEVVAEGEDVPSQGEEVAAEAPSPAVAEQETVAEHETVAAEAEVEEEQEDEEPAPREKPSVPGAHLEVDIVPEGVDPLSRSEGYEDAYAVDPYAIDDEVEEAQDSDAQEREEDLAEPISTAAIDLASGARYRATGKRKSAIARVTLRPGTGSYLVNGRTLEDHFPRLTLQRNIRQPLETVGYQDRMDVVARLHGGGISAQAGALRHGVSRALLEADPNLRGELKRRGFLTRDSRAKERKKAGLKKARKRPQFSKR